MPPEAAWAAQRPELGHVVLVRNRPPLRRWRPASPLVGDRTIVLSVGGYALRPGVTVSGQSETSSATRGVGTFFVAGLRRRRRR